MKLRHYLQPLVTPASVALVGASERPGSLGRIVFENLLAGGFNGDIVAVNPNRKRILGHRVARSLATVKKPVDCAVIATPCDHVADGPRAGRRRRDCKAAVILTHAPVGATAAQRWERDVAAAAATARHSLRGPRSRSA